MPCYRLIVLLMVSAVGPAPAFWGLGHGCSWAESLEFVSLGQIQQECLGPEGLGPASTSSQEAVWREAGLKEPFLYDLRFHLEVAGRMKLLSKTRYYRSEDLHVKLRAKPCTEGWDFRSLSLSQDAGEINFGIGEGPRRHQRYILLTARPSAEEKRLIQQEVLTLERTRGCGVRESLPEGVAHKPYSEGKRGYFNYYLWEDTAGTFNFVLSPTGRCLSVENDVELHVLEKEGGRRANPVFFETLEYALLAMAPFIQAPVQPQDGIPARWETDCGDVLRGLVGFSKGVYGKKMTLLEPENLIEQRVSYTARRVPGTCLLRIRGSLAATQYTPIRISGLKGRIWIDSLRRDVYLDTRQGRIVKDIVEISFGVDRNKKIFSLFGAKNIVRISLVDDCLLACADTEDAILMAYQRCLSAASGM